MNRAVFLDRDGVIVEDTGFVHKVEDFKMIPNAIEGLKLLNRYLLFIVTNQSGIGRGVYKIEDFTKFNNRLLDELGENGIEIKKTYYCFHKPEDNCECRKPEIRFLLDAQKEFSVDLKGSYVIGDRKSDFEMGEKAGCKTIHVLTGNGTNSANEVVPDYFAKDLLDAAQWIVDNDR